MASKKPGVSLGKLLGVAAGVGAVIGVLMSLRQQRQLENQLDELYLNGDQTAGFQPPHEKPREDYMRADALALQGIPPYPGARPRRLSSNTDVQGEPMSSAWFSTEDSVQDVISFYQKAFENLNSIKVSHYFSPRAGYAGFFELLPAVPDSGESLDFFDGRVHLVTAVKSGSQTMVFISNNRPQMMLGGASPRLGDIQLPDNVKTRVLSVGEGELKKRSAFGTVDQPLPELKKHFEAAFTNAGWKMNDWVTDEQRAMMVEATRDGRTAVLNLSSNGASSRFLLTVDEYSSPPPTPEPLQ